MKIVGVCNFNKESVADILVADNIKNDEIALLFKNALNTKYCKTGYSPTYFEVKPDDYKLWRGMEELV